MGMGASQARLLELTDRKHCIGLQLQECAFQKDSLVAQAHEISKKYNEALKGKVLKWSNNGGVNYVDLTYSTLMRPNAANGNSPLLLTTNSGRVILDQKYKKYAERFSPDGKNGKDWMNYSERPSILSELTGISADKISNSDVLSADAKAKQLDAAEAREDMDKAKARATSALSASDFAKKWGTVSGHNFVTPTGKIQLGPLSTASAALKSCLDGIGQSMKNYLPESDYEKFTTACDECYQSTKARIDGYATQKENFKEGYILVGDDKNLKLDVEQLIRSIMASYKGDQRTDKNGNTTYTCVKSGLDSDEWQKYLVKADLFENAQAAFDEASNQSAILLTADEESIIQFYDRLFIAIGENGWQDDCMINDNDYLNQMLQNNEFYITQMKEAEYSYDYDANGDSFGDRNEYDYEIDLWSNTNNIFAVNDEYARQEALTEYEFEKSEINKKEKRIDLRMTNLETEQNAITTMIKGIEQQIHDNIDRNFNLFT